MMAAAALTLGVKLCGFSGQRLILVVTAVGGIAEVWHNRKPYLTGISGGFQKLIRSPIAIAILVAGLLVFLILFRLAGLQGLVEFDAVAAWSLKAKIMHLYNGTELVQWFFQFRVWRMRILTIPRLYPRCMQPRMIPLDMWMSLSPSSGPPGCCCFFCSPWPH